MSRARSISLACVGLGLVVLLGNPTAWPQAADDEPARVLSGTLARIKSSGIVRIGYREQAVPFSYVGPDRVPLGYSIDLCREIVEDIARELGADALTIEYRRVTPADRLDQIVARAIDLECGATTTTEARRGQVSFSPLIFVSGTKLLVRRGDTARSVQDLRGRKIVAVRGTTNEAAMRALVAKRGSGFELVVEEGYAQALARLAARDVDALAADDILLTGMIAERGLRDRYRIVGELLSHEPYGIVFAHDDAPLARVVQRSFERLATTRELRWIYARWFERSLPSGMRLGVAMSTELEAAFEMLGLPPE